MIGLVLAALLAFAPAGASGSDPTAGLPLRQLAAQRIVVGWPGRRPPRSLLRRIRRGEVGGVIVFSRNFRTRAELRRTLRRLQAVPRPRGLRAPLLVMTDQEGGLVKRLPGAPSRSPAELGRIGSRRLAGEEGRATARNLLGARVNVDLAPVVDVGRPGSFQRRYLRSYGARPGLVAALGSAFARGLQSGGVAATLKHFPGIGAARGNADLATQRIGLSRSRLRRVDERPFGTAIRAGAKLVMTSTAVYPAFSRLPAVLSRRLTTGELRHRLRFGGVTITDSLGVASLARFGGPATLAVGAAEAGNDLLLYEDERSGALGLRALVDAVRGGRLSRAGMRAAVRRIVELRRGLR